MRKRITSASDSSREEKHEQKYDQKTGSPILFPLYNTMCTVTDILNCLHGFQYRTNHTPYVGIIFEGSSKK